MKKITSLLKLNKDLICIMLIIFLSIFLILPFLRTGFFPTHDGEWAVVRLADMYRELKDFQIPPRYSSNLNFGYGYPLFNFAYPFPYYLGIIFYLLGLGFVGSIKSLFILSVSLSGISMFFLGKRIWENLWAGFSCAVLYMYFPYRMVDLYVRGSLGESLAFILFPLIILFIYKLFNGEHEKLSVVMLSCLTAFLIMTHNIMTVLFFPIIFLFLLIGLGVRKYHASSRIICAVFGGMCIASFFWIPALAEKNNISLSVIPIADRNLYFVNPRDLLVSPWGYGTPTEADSFTYQLGLAHIIGTLITLGAILTGLRKKKNSYFFLGLYMLIFIILYLFMLFKPSNIIWSNLPLLKEINYPWTIIAPLGFLMSILIGYMSRFRRAKAVICFLIIVAIINCLPYAQAKEHVNRGDSFYLTNDATTTSSDELMPLWVKEKPPHRYSEKIEILSGEGEIREVLIKSNSISFSTNLNRDERIRINTIYYPGWKAIVDSHKKTIFYDNSGGFMEIEVPRQSKNVKLILTETPLRAFADVLSLFTVILIVIYSIYNIKSNLVTARINKNENN